MKKFITTILSLALFVVGCGSDNTTNSNPAGPSTSSGSASPSSTAQTVNIPVGAVGQGSAAYGVNPLVIAVGTTVTWVNQDTVPHTATSDTGVWDSGTLNNGQSYSFTFSNAGTYPYHCTIHGAQSMSGSIQVNPGPTPTSTASPLPSPTPTASPTPSPTASATTMNISIAQGSTGRGPLAFGTNPLVASAGTTFVWTNNDSVPHTVTSDTGAFDSGTMNPGQTFSVTLSNVGDHPYHCTIHGAASMSGNIRITNQ